MSTGTLWGCCCSWCNTLCWSSLLKPRARETPSRWTCANLSREEDEMLPITVLATAAPVCDPALALGEFLTAPYWGLWGEFIPLNSLPGLTGYGWKWHGCYTKLLWRIGGKKKYVFLLKAVHFWEESTLRTLMLLPSIEKYNLSALSTWHP